MILIFPCIKVIFTANVLWSLASVKVKTEVHKKKKKKSKTSLKTYTTNSNLTLILDKDNCALNNHPQFCRQASLVEY